MPRGHYDRSAKQTAPVPDAHVATPVRLTAPFGFITEIEAVYFKAAGTIITNPLEIAALRERMAPLEDV